ncbi:MAG: type II restriction endonuclease [Pyrinomonadaceae bacterium]
MFESRFRTNLIRTLAPCLISAAAAIVLALSVNASAQGEQLSAPPALRGSKAEIGSRTARNGFLNESEIAAKFNGWAGDKDAQDWLASMGYKLGAIESVTATKPHGEKADVVVRIKTKLGDRSEGISIKLVSTPQGFNQIDKRWLSGYQRMWRMPENVVHALRLFVGEIKPGEKTRNAERMFLNELDAETQKSVLSFFESNRDRILSDIFIGNGPFAAKWLMVALKSREKPKWTIRKIEDAIRFFGQGPVVITRGGNLRIGRITMQRKGGDAGRDTAKMLQFKIDPAELFDTK